MDIGIQKSEKKSIKSYKDLEIYNLSYELAMEIFFLSKKFPKGELYSLTSQIVRSSRSISVNITEGWAKRYYVFKQHLINAFGSAMETNNWLSFAKDCNYIDSEEYSKLSLKTGQIGKMIYNLHNNWKTYKKD